MFSIFFFHYGRGNDRKQLYIYKKKVLKIYRQLRRNFQLLYPDSKFTFITIIIGALDFVSNCLTDRLDSLGFLEKEINQHYKYTLQIKDLSQI